MNYIVSVSSIHDILEHDNSLHHSSTGLRNKYSIFVD